MSTTSSSSFSAVSLLLIAVFELCLGAVPAPGTQPVLQLFEAVEPHMGTLMQIELYARDQAQAQSALRQAFDRIAALDDILSDYKPDSELNRVCRTAWQRPVRVSPELFHILAASQTLAAETHGAFDVTVGPLTHLWREARRTRHAPEAQMLREARSHCGYGKLELDASTQTVKLAESGMQLDVGGIGKGYAADEALAVLHHRQIQSALVAASGDLAFSDAPPGQPGWRIRIVSFNDAGAPREQVLFLKDGAASTSGDAEQHLDVGAVRYSHIVDPKTGLGLTQSIAVTVIARDGTEADGFATAVSVLGLDRGMNFIERDTSAAARIVIRAQGIVTIRDSSRFQLLQSDHAAE